MTRDQTIAAICGMMERADLNEMSMSDMTFCVGALGMINDEQYQIMEDWGTSLCEAWSEWSKIRGHTSESMWTNMAAFGIGDSREFTALAKATKKVKKVWKRRPIGLTA